ncbi:MAG: NAD-glutamate dehydrogenase [Nitrospirota bacterium]|jgi:glutamate dehydrogenase
MPPTLSTQTSLAQRRTVRRKSQVLTWLRGNTPKKEHRGLERIAEALFGAVSAHAADLSVEEWGAIVRTAKRFLARSVPEEDLVKILPAGWDLGVANLEECCGAPLDTSTTTVVIRCQDSPFIFEAVRNFLRKRGIHIFLSLHPVLEQKTGPEQLIYLQIDKVVHPDRLAELRMDVAWLLRGVMLSIDDFARFNTRLVALARDLQAGNGDQEVAAFAEWLADDHFIFLGYQAFEADGRDKPCRPVRGSSLGMFRDQRVLERLLPGLGEEVADCVASMRSALAIDFSPAGTRVAYHNEPVECLMLETRSRGGKRRRHCLVGRLSRGGLLKRSSGVPFLRAKLAAIQEARGRTGGRYQRREIETLFNYFPKRELLYSPVADLIQRFDEVLSVQGDEGLSVGYRLGKGDAYWAVTVGLPRTRFGEDTAWTIAGVVAEAFGHPVLDRVEGLGDAVGVLVFYLPANGGSPPPAAVLHERIRDALTEWEDEFLRLLVERYGEHPAFVLLHRYGPRLPVVYKECTDPRVALVEVEHLERLAEGTGPIPYCIDNDRGELQLRILAAAPLDLMALIPMLRHLGLAASDEIMARLTRAPSKPAVHVVTLGGPEEHLEAVRTCQNPLCEALAAVLRGEMQDEPSNALILHAGLSPSAVRLFRTLRGYLLQVNQSLMETGILRTVLTYPAAIAALHDYFSARFDPDLAGDRDEAMEQAASRFADRLAEVTGLADDEILRGLFNVAAATVRTNYFTSARDHYLALKIDSQAIDKMPEPRPLVEIFVHARGMEGIHLRGGRVARGGLRWSDRPDDFRTEVLGLMKAQMVKNSVIVPVGSKGGFVLRRTSFASRDEQMSHLRAQYQTFVAGLLGLTDNVVAGRVVHPPGVVIHDGDDPYLVVAADKGTAHLSDAANEVADRLGFWLGDAFASGGAKGYDHKKEAITARGAWECVKRHFRELDHDIQNEPFTVVGIGDMAGDVFGNGMLLSRHIRLQVAFNHRHIFVDPDPDPARSYKERERLFRLAGSTWRDYDTSLISNGGGVFERAGKAIELAPNVRDMLGAKRATVSGEELIRLALTMEVDLLYNGGIGTYIKASTERHVDVGDKANDRVRVDASAVRARVVCEGGNLGITQLGRLEYAAHGGRINTDAVDNSAGVDMSDHEVNLKLLCQVAMEEGRLKDSKARDRLLVQVTEEVAELCLADNYHQSACVSLDQRRGRESAAPFVSLIERRVADGVLAAEEEQVPVDEALDGAVKAHGGLLRPTLCTLLGYEKMRLQAALTGSPLVDLPGAGEYLRAYFPRVFVRRFGELLERHPLRAEIVATVMVNKIVNQAGITFFSEMEEESGAPPWEIAYAYLVAERIVDADSYRDWLAKLDNKMEAAVQYDLALRQEELLGHLTQRLLHRSPEERPSFADISHYRRHVRAFEASFAGDDHTKEVAALRQQGVPAPLAQHAARLPRLRGIFEVIDLHQEMGTPFVAIGQCLVVVGDALCLDELRSRLAGLVVDGEWQEQARHDLLEQVSRLRYRLVTAALRRHSQRHTVAEAVNAFFAERSEPLRAYRERLAALVASDRADAVMFSVVLHQLRDLLPE